jgi:hypothetical protein
MLDLNMPLLTDAGAKDLGRNLGRNLGRDLGRDLGAEATANLLRIVESGTTRLLVGGLLVLGAGALAFYTLRELRSASSVQHEVFHLNRDARGVRSARGSRGSS